MYMNHINFHKLIFCFRARKILSIRLFDGEDDKRWDKSGVDKQYEVLCVSQVCIKMGLKCSGQTV